MGSSKRHGQEVEQRLFLASPKKVVAVSRGEGEIHFWLGESDQERFSSGWESLTRRDSVLAGRLLPEEIQFWLGESDQEKFISGWESLTRRDSVLAGRV
ncbi:hypothetical protein RRG08_026344 [Elysia crispata]|uniref:Uncharacterized protein n=1 Tax=Elysia crispata TaxID=231223 RepID=A0AAE0XMY4_9GAST|nr:hypothetical protein RRG08_026344 [Elysia crispata]